MLIVPPEGVNLILQIISVNNRSGNKFLWHKSYRISDEIADDLFHLVHVDMNICIILKH